MHRREYLTALGGAAIALAGCTDEGDGSTTVVGGSRTSVSAPLRRRAIAKRFEEVVDIVEQTGCDPSGETDCADAIESAVEPGRAIRFPDGRFRLDRPLELTADGPLGVVGSDGATLVPRRGFNGMAVTLDATEALVHGFDVDLSAPGTTAGTTVAADEWLRVSGVTYNGRGDHPGRSSPFAFNLAVRESGGTGTAVGLVARRGAAAGHYKGGGGRGGIWIGPANKGTVRVQDCRFEEFANNGIYASRTSGDVEVVGGTYRNNNIAAVRIGGKGSFVRNVTIDVDFEDYDGPRSRFEDQFVTRGIVLEQGPETDSKPPGVEIENCSITVADSPTTGAGISAWSTGRTLAVRDTSIRIDADDFRGIFRAPRVSLGNRMPSSFPRHVTLENVTIDVTTPNATAIQLADAPHSTLRSCSISQRHNAAGAAIHLTRSADSTIDGGRILVRGPLARLEDLPNTTPEKCLFSIGRAVDNETSSPASADTTSDLQRADSCLTTDHLSGGSLAKGIEIVSVSDNRIFYRVGTDR